MQIFEVTIRGVTPYSQSKHYEVEKLQGEGNDDYYQRTWRNHMHVKDGLVFMPPNGYKNCLSESAKYMNIGVPGKGKTTYTKHFEAGVQVAKPIFLVDHNNNPIKSVEVPREKLFLPSDGKRGSGKRVWKYYPYMENWGGVVEVIVLDETVLQTSRTTGKTILEDVCVGAGQFIGMGRFRPRNNGYYGRFDIVSVIEVVLKMAA